LVYLDEAKLSNFSRRKLHPVYIVAAALSLKYRYHSDARVLWGFISTEVREGRILEDNLSEALSEMVNQFLRVETGFNFSNPHGGISTFFVTWFLTLGICLIFFSHKNSRSPRGK